MTLALVFAGIILISIVLWAVESAFIRMAQRFAERYWPTPKDDV